MATIVKSKESGNIMIRKYLVKDHRYVNKLYDSIIYEPVSDGIKIGLRSPGVLAYLSLAFILGYQASFYLAVTALGFAMGIQALSVFLVYTLSRK